MKTKNIFASLVFLSLSSTALAATTVVRVSVSSPTSGSTVASSFTLSGSCDRRGSAVSISGGVANSGTATCSSLNRYSYVVRVANVSGAKQVSVSQKVQKNTYSASVTYNYIAVVATPTPTATPVATPVATPTPTPTPVATATPAPTATPTTGWLPSPTLGGLAAILSGFDPYTSIGQSYFPGFNAGEPGAFRFMCSGGQLLYDDPLVYPGQPGKAHLHQFFGNTSANAHSTYDSLRKNGGSTCGDPKANAANRSAYWIPALLDGKGNVVRPDSIDIYYKRMPKTHIDCTSGLKVKECLGLPNGLRFLMGYDMATGKNKVPFGFYCETVSGTYFTLAEAVKGCPVNSKIYVRTDAPSCWDGRSLDSPNHRDHLSYMEDTHLGYYACPSTHPYGIPTLTLSIGFRIAAPDDTSLWRFSSDEMHPDLPAGSTMHADYMEAWDPTVKKMWEDNAIDKQLNCVGGALGNGYSILDADQMTYYINGSKVKSWTNPIHLEPVPAMPPMSGM